MKCWEQLYYSLFVPYWHIMKYMYLHQRKEKLHNHSFHTLQVSCTEMNVRPIIKIKLSSIWLHISYLHIIQSQSLIFGAVHTLSHARMSESQTINLTGSCSLEVLNSVIQFKTQSWTQRHPARLALKACLDSLPARGCAVTTHSTVRAAAVLPLVNEESLCKAQRPWSFLSGLWLGAGKEVLRKAINDLLMEGFWWHPRFWSHFLVDDVAICQGNFWNVVVYCKVPFWHLMRICVCSQVLISQVHPSHELIVVLSQNRFLNDPMPPFMSSRLHPFLHGVVRMHRWQEGYISCIVPSTCHNVCTRRLHEYWVIPSLKAELWSLQICWHIFASLMDSSAMSYALNFQFSN